MSPPRPHNAPNAYAHIRLRAGVAWIAARASGTSRSAIVHGATSQLKIPPTSQYVSHDQRRTAR